ncbi:MAG: hypothetical protein KAU48_01565 [Candidatus Thorarchaeota archaeon]|nr:hypothetical protein [Candidatus Thorarchaeota archaeon]
MKSADETTMLLQIPGPAPDLILISLFFLGLLYFLVWRLDRRPQVFGIESSRSRRPRFIASATITAIFLVSLVYLLSQSDLIQFPLKYVIPLSLTGILLVLIFIDLGKQYKAL